MEAEVLQLLPPRGLDQSILLAVLLGLFVLLSLTEWFGWVFAGLVVPGYLASVFVMSFGAGIAVSFEAIVTFLLAKFVTGFVSKTEAGTQFFGRERFFLIVLLSVIVRQNSEIWLLPTIAPWIDVWFDTTFAAERQLASIGLVLVPLTANMFWKLNVPRGVFQVGVPVFITYALLTYVFLPYTNLSYSTLELTYEDAALNFLASPKAYLILLCGAFLASRFNLIYGWDYNGILVPALLSLTWMDPQRIATTVIEALVLLYTARVFISLPGLSTLNFEGPRKVVLVFTIGFIIKYSFSWLIGDYAPTQSVTDLFGFGYLLPSLLAVKMLQKKTVGKVLLPALETSLLAFVMANLIGMGLDLLEPPNLNDSGRRITKSSGTDMLARTPMGAALTARTRARLDVARAEPLERSRSQLIRYRELWRRVSMALEDGPDQVRDLQFQADVLGLELRELHDRGDTTAFVLLEREESLGKQVGWDTAILFPGRPGPVLSVPRPHSEDYTAVAAAYICRKIRCRAILISGVDTVRSGVETGDVLRNDRASFHYAQDGLGRTQIVQLRVFSTPAGASPAGTDDTPDDSTGDTPGDPTAAARAKPTLHIKGRLSSELDLDALWPVPVDISWERPPDGANVPWSRRTDLAVFRVPSRDMEEQLFLCARAIQTIDGEDLGPWLAERFDALELDDERTSPGGAPCDWLPIEDAEVDYDDLLADDELGITRSDDDEFADQDERNLIFPDLLAMSGSIPSMAREAIQPFLVPHVDSLCSAGTNIGEWVDRTLLQDDVPPLSNKPLSETELTFMREHLLIPLLADIRSGSLAAEGHIYWLSKLAYQIGYEIVLVENCDLNGGRCWLLAQHSDSDVKSSVLALVRAGDAAPLAIEVPKPDLEPGTWRLGLELWRDTNARILLMGVPVTARFPPRARKRRRIRDHMFHTLHKAIDRALTLEPGSQRLILQVRGYGSWRQLQDDLVIGIGRPLLTWPKTDHPDAEPGPRPEPEQPDASDSSATTDPANAASQSAKQPGHQSGNRVTLAADMPPMLRSLLLQRQHSDLNGYGTVRLADGAEEIIALRGAQNRQLSYSRLVGQTDMAILWFSQNARLKYRRFSNPHQCRLLAYSGLSPIGAEAHRDAPRSFFLTPPLRAPLTVHNSVDALPEPVSEIVALLARAASFENPNLLGKLTYLARTRDDLYLAAGTDAEFGRPFLTATVDHDDHVYRIVAILGKFLDEPTAIAAGADDTERHLDVTLSRRASPVVVYGRDAPAVEILDTDDEPEVLP